MANRCPKNPRFSNITVSNNGNGLVDSDKVNAETVYVKNLVVTDTMRIPVSNLHNLNPEDKTFIRINRQYQPIAKDSGLLFLDSSSTLTIKLSIKFFWIDAQISLMFSLIKLLFLI